MKKLFLILMLITVVAAGAFAQLSVGLTTGFSYSLENTTDAEDFGYSVRKIGIPVLAEVGYKLPLELELALPTGPAVLIVGGRLGYANLWGIENSDVDGSSAMWTIPLYGFGRLESGMFYADLGIGFNFWTVDAEIGGADLGDNGTGFSLMFSPGVKFNLYENFDLLAGLAYYTFSYENDDGFAASNTIGVNVTVIMNIK